MNLWVLNLVTWMLGIRGHIPRDGDFGGGRGHSSLAASGTLMRILAVGVLCAALLSLTLWAVVWLTIKLL
jgi:hypothetical protein